MMISLNNDLALCLFLSFYLYEIGMKSGCAKGGVRFAFGSGGDFHKKNWKNYGATEF